MRVLSLGCAINDPATAQMQRLHEQKQRDQWAKRQAKAHGGSWKCQGGCGRLISANKDLCAQCAEKKAEEHTA